MEYEQIMTALRNAHAAGDQAAAQRLAQMAREAQARQSAPEAMPQGSPASPQPTAMDLLRQQGAISPEGGSPQYDMLSPLGFDPTGVSGAVDGLQDNLIGIDNDVTTPLEAAGSWLNRAGESMTLGLVGDEASAAAYSALPGRTYEGELDRFRQNEQGLGTVGRLSADITGGIVPALAGIGIVGQAASLPGRMATGAALGAGAGTTQGFMEGEGGLGERGVSAALGGVAGGVLGGAIPLGAEVGRAAVGGARNMARNASLGRQLSGELGVSPQASRVVAALVGADDQAAMQASLTRAGPGAMLADASPAISGSLDATLQAPVPGVQAARQRIGDRAGQSFDQITQALQGSAPVRGVRGTMSDIASSTADTRSTAYNRAYTTPIDYSSPEGMEVQRVFDALPPRIIRNAVEQANEQIIWDVNMGRLPEGARSIMAQVADDGTVSYQELPNVMQLDYVKRAIDEIAQGEVDQFGRQTAAGRSAADMARTLRNAVTKASPEYEEALAAGMDNSTRINAVRFGTELLSPRTTTEEALGEIRNATAPQREAMKDGLRAQMREVFGNVNAVPSDQNIDARQAASALRQFSSPNAQEKLSALFGEEWPALQSQIDQAGAALGLRARVANNSMTAGRGFANEMIDDVTMPSAIQRGKPLEALSNFAGGVTGASPEAIRGMREGVRSELADILTRQGGAPQRTIDAVTRALAANPMQLNAGGNTALGLGIGGYTAAPALVQELMRGMRQ